MKKNLFLTAVIAITALTFFGCQDPIKDLTITQTPGSAPEVAAESIKAKPIPEFRDGTILVSWDYAENGAKYDVWRREVKVEGDDKTPQENTALQIASDVSTKTVEKMIPYYEDNTTKAGTVYQYGIVSTTYKSGGTNSDVIQKSDIVWQSLVEGENYATAPAKQTVVEFIENPATAPVVTLTEVKDIITADNTDIPSVANGGLLYANDKSVRVADYFKIEVKGLTFGYNYKIYLQTSTDSTNTANSSSSVWINGSDLASVSQWNGQDRLVYDKSVFIREKLEGYTPVWTTQIAATSNNLKTHLSLTEVNSDSGVYYNVQRAAAPEMKAIKMAVEYSTSGLNVLKVKNSNTADVVKGLKTSAWKDYPSITF